MPSSIAARHRLAARSRYDRIMKAASPSALQVVLGQGRRVAGCLSLAGILLVLAPTTGRSAPQPGPHDQRPAWEPLVRACLDDINHARFDDALRCSDRLKSAFPASAAGPFVAATVYQTQMSNYRVRRFDPEFHREITEAIDRARAAAQNDPSPENDFVWGAAEGYRCLYWFREGGWLKAVRAARRGASLLKKAYEQDPSLADAQMGIALYNYGLSKVRLLGIPIFGNRDEKVDRLLKEARDKARLIRVDARYATQYVLVDRGEYARALPISEGLVEQFPRDPVALYNLALILEHVGRQNEARPLWHRLIDVLNAFPPPSQGFLAECYYHLARIAHSDGDAALAGRMIDRAWYHAWNRHADQEIDGPYQSTSDLRQAILHDRRTWPPPPPSDRNAQVQ
jgi:tetratricopeptide (TPR) repeat protein